MVDIKLEKFFGFWKKASRLGVKGDSYLSERRIVLTNQIAIIAAVISISFAIFYAVYDLKQMKLVVADSVIASMLYLSVLMITYKGNEILAKLLLLFTACIHLFVLVYLLSNASGIHLYYFAVILGAFFVFSKDEIVWVSAYYVFPISLFLIAQFVFTPENSYLQVDPDLLKGLYLSSAIFTFLLVSALARLFYVEILRSENLLLKEHERSESLLLNILPKSIADRLKSAEKLIADAHNDVTILFADIVGFTEFSARISASNLVDILNNLFVRFDLLTDKYELEKIKTIGDAYMVAAGVPVAQHNHAESIALLALDMLNELEEFNDDNGLNLDIRIGIHSGSIVAGVIGHKKFAYDIWGDAVNTASRMESHGINGKIHVSIETCNLLRDKFMFEERGEIEIKGKGKIKTYFLTGKKSTQNH